MLKYLLTASFLKMFLKLCTVQTNFICLFWKSLVSKILNTLNYVVFCEHGHQTRITVEEVKKKQHMSSSEAL